MSNQKRLLTEPPILKILSGLVRAGKRYYRVNPDTGFHTPVAARAELLKLMSQVTVTRILREAVSAGLITEQKIDLAQESHPRAAAEADVVSNNDTEDEEPDESTSHHSKSPLGLSDIPKG